jgi:hypothetical protein
MNMTAMVTVMPYVSCVDCHRQNASMNSVTTGVAANQIIKNAIQVSAMANGSPTSSPSPLQQSLRGPTPTSISLSAITPSLVITPNKTAPNVGVGVAPKPGQTLLIATTKDGPMIVQPSANPLPQQSLNSGADATNSAVTTSSVVTIASRNMVSSMANSGSQQPNLMQQLVANHPNQIQFQLVTNVNPASRPPPANPNMGPNARTLAPRVVQLPSNVRLTQQLLRPGGTPAFGQVCVSHDYIVYCL